MIDMTITASEGGIDAFNNAHVVYHQLPNIDMLAHSTKCCCSRHTLTAYRAEENFAYLVNIIISSILRAFDHGFIKLRLSVGSLP